MKVFCYGTLMRGFGNYERLLEGRSEFLGLGETRPYFTMYDLGHFPGVVNEGQTSILGDVFEIDSQVRASLDRLEGHPNFYVRTPIVLRDSSLVEIYILANGERVDRYAQVPSGDWRSHTGVKR